VQHILDDRYILGFKEWMADLLDGRTIAATAARSSCSWVPVLTVASATCRATAGSSQRHLKSNGCVADARRCSKPCTRTHITCDESLQRWMHHLTWLSCKTSHHSRWHLCLHDVQDCSEVQESALQRRLYSEGGNMQYASIEKVSMYATEA